MTPIRLLPFPAVGLLAALPLAAQTPALVEDVNRTAFGTTLIEDRQVVAWNGFWYFARRDAATGLELWRARSNPPLLQLVADIAPGPADSSPDALTILGSTMYFHADDGMHGRELWATDGTPAGTRLVADVRPGPNPGLAGNAYWHRPFGVANNTLFFLASSTGGFATLWRSDGTAPGTFALHPGAQPGRDDDFATMGNRLFFNSTGALWVSDGTTAGTSMLASFYSGASNLAAVGNRVFFTAASSLARGYELWVTDGTTAGTYEVLDIDAAPNGSSYPSGQTDVGGVCVFTADDGVNGRELWRSDGTPAGTFLLRDIRPGTGGGTFAFGFRGWPVAGGRMFFCADDGASGIELWSTDGTIAGTSLVADLAPGAASGLPSRWLDATVAGNRVFFAANGGGTGLEPWSSDGTAAGTMLAADLRPGAAGSDPHRFAGDPAGEVAFVADPGTGAAVHATRGSPATTLRLADAFPTANGYSDDADPLGLAELDGRVVFTADDGIAGHEPWVAQGFGAARIADLRPGPLPSIWNGDPVAAFTYEFPTVRFAGDLWFFAGSGAVPVELWRTDGTTAGTTLARTFDPVQSGGTGMGYQLRGTVCNGRLFFLAHQQGAGWGLWHTDGAGTFVRDIGVGSSGLVATAGNVAYALTINFGSTTLTRSDGTPAGSMALRAFSGGGGLQTGLAAAGTRLIFAGTDGPSGEELWVSDGTAPGTGLLIDLLPGSGSSRPRHVTTFGRRVLFSASDGASGTEPWITDGTAFGTRRLADVAPGSAGSDPADFVDAGEFAWFTANGPTGHELWRTDGTPGGTVWIASFAAPQSGRGVRQVRPLGSRFVGFAGYEPSSGLEPWVSDGTPAGTHLWHDVNPGRNYAAPGPMLLADGRVWFAADDGVHGRELWFGSLGASSQRLGEGCSPSGLPPRLLVDDPVLGAAVDIELQGGAANAAGLLAIALPARPSLSLLGCDLFVDLSTMLLHGFALDAQGAFALRGVPVPPDPALRSLRLAVQALAFEPAGFALSNGVLATLGD